MSADIEPGNPGSDMEERWWPSNHWPHVTPMAYDHSGGTAAPAGLADIYATSAAGDHDMRFFSAEYWAKAMEVEFVGAFTWSGDLLDSCLPASADAVKEELAELAGLIEYRPGVLEEAIFQVANIEDPFRGILTYSAATHPATTRLVGLALTMAVVAEFHYKRLYARPRPSQLSPALMPPIDPPGHASFPSGHATEAMAVALILKEVMPGLAKTHRNKDNSADNIRDPLLDMARRIARNREILGLHYPSDSRAGQLLAEKVVAVVKTMTGVADLITQARAEWSVAAPWARYSGPPASAT
jgi:membrane-associated phospholipid phosphatase